MIDYKKEKWIDVSDPNNPENGAIPITAEILDKIEQGIIDTNTDINNRITDECLFKSGGVMTGSLILNGVYENDNEAVDKKYVDNFQSPWHVEDEKGVAIQLKCLNISSLGRISAYGTEDDLEYTEDEEELFTSINNGIVWLQFTVNNSSLEYGYFELKVNGKRLFFKEVASAGTTTYKKKISLNKGDIVSGKCYLIPNSKSSSDNITIRDVYLFANIDSPFCYQLTENEMSKNATLI